MEAAKKKYAVRLAPCSVYENGRMIAWLEEMAQRGYLLSEMIGGIAIFERGEPRKVRYRLTDLPADSFLKDKSPSSQDELIAICEASGWKFIAQRSFFGIFATEDENAPELDTDWHGDYGKSVGFMCYIIAFIFLLSVLPCLVAAKNLWWLVLAVIPISYWSKKVPSYIDRLADTLIIVSTLGILLGSQRILMHYRIAEKLNISSAELIPYILSSLFFIGLTIYLFVGPLRYFIQRKRGEDVNCKKDWKRKAPVYRLTYVAIAVILIYLFLHMFDGLA